MHIRFIQNIKVSLTKADGTTKKDKVFRFGECWAATKIESSDDYVTVYLSNGDKIEYVTPTVFENYNVPVIELKVPTSKQTRKKKDANESTT